MAARLEELKIFHHFDVDGDGGLDRTEMEALVGSVNTKVNLAGEEVRAVVDGIVAGEDGRHLTPDALRANDDGTADVDGDGDRKLDRNEMEAPVRSVNTEVKSAGEEVRAVVDEVVAGKDGPHLTPDALRADDDGTGNVYGDSDGVLGRKGIEAPVRSVNMEVTLAGEQERAVVDEVVAGEDGRHLTPDAFRANDEGSSDVDGDGDGDGDGVLDRNVMEALVQSVNRNVNLAGEEVRAVVVEVVAGEDGGRHLTPHALRANDEGTADVDGDGFGLLGLSTGDDGLSRVGLPYRAPSTSNAQLTFLPPRPSRLGAEGFDEIQIRRRRWQRMEEIGEEEAVESRDDRMQDLTGGAPSAQRTGEQHPSSGTIISPRAVPEGDGVFPSPSPAWGRQYSLLSSVASSSFCSGTYDSELDYRDYPWQSEVEEIPSYRWLSRSPSPPRESSEVDWGQLASPVKEPGLVDKITDNFWVVLVVDKTSGERCAIVLARGLKIAWDDKVSTCWRHHAGAAILSEVSRLDIEAKVDAADLSPGTSYVCLLVFQLLPAAYGLGLGGETQRAWVSVGGEAVSVRTVRLQPPASREGWKSSEDGAGEPRRRRDGWLEIELGEFSSPAENDDGVWPVWVCVGLTQMERLLKGGLLVRGVEMRPKFRRHPSPGKGMVRVSRVPRGGGLSGATEPFWFGERWVLSSWLDSLRSTGIWWGANDSDLDQILLQGKFADWMTQNPVATPFTTPRSVKAAGDRRPRPKIRFRIPNLYQGFGFRFPRASS